MALPGRTWGFWAAFGLDASRENIQMGPPVGLQADLEVFPIGIRPKSSQGFHLNCPSLRPAGTGRIVEQ